MSSAHKLISNDPFETVALGKALGHELQTGHVIGLVGPLGAGKTCFVQGVAQGLGIDPQTYISSPTFTLINEYQGRIPLYHIDLYRLSAPEELVEIGIDHYYRGEGTCLVEWFDRFPDDWPPTYLKIELVVTGDLTRCFEVHAVGDSHKVLAHRWAEK